MRIIIELVFILILGASIWTGHKRGLVPGIATLLAIIISMCAANALAGITSDKLTNVISPFLEGYMDGSNGVVNKCLDSFVGGGDLSVEDAIKSDPALAEKLSIASYEEIGMSSSAAKKLAGKALETYSEGKSSLTSCVIGVMSRAIAYALSFTIFFALAIIILSILLNLIDLSLKSKISDKLNHIGGIAAGALTGVFFCCFAAWILKFLGVIISQEHLGGIAVSWLFISLDPLAWILPC